MNQPKDNVIDAVLTLKMVNDSKTEDPTIMMRMQLLALEIARNPNITLNELKQTSGYGSCIHNISIGDDYLQSLLNEPIVLEAKYSS